MRYDGKNAWWFILIVVFFNLFPISIFMDSDVQIDVILIISLMFYYLLFDLLCLPILIRNYIQLYDDHFLFFYGFGKRKVSIKQIAKIERTRDMSASSANSLDRIYIETKDDDFMISLKRNDEFIEEIRKRMRDY